MRYFEYFERNPHTGFSGGILSFLEFDEGQLPAATQVGTAFFTEGSNANANAIADSFARFGLPGVIVVVGVLAFYLRMLDSLTVRSNNRQLSLAYGAALTPGLILANAGLVTSIVANGLLAGLVVLFLAPSANSERPTTPRSQITHIGSHEISGAQAQTNDVPSVRNAT
jgi:hypothetical protein